MKSAKDFAEVWKISSASAGRKLKRLGAIPESKVGAVLFYSDEVFSKLTGVKTEKIDFSNLISSAEIASKFNLKDKLVKDKLRKNHVEVELTDGGISYYSKDKALICFQEKPKKLNTKKVVNHSDSSKRYRLSILSKDGSKFVVKYVALTKEGCWKRIQAWFEQGWDFCVRSYDVEKYL